MAHRTFRDEHGREWDVWEVVPTAVERRIAESPAPPPPGTVERRMANESRVVVPDKLQKGWLAFQCGPERRRLTPIPADWSEMSSNDLIGLLNRSQRGSRARRLIE